MRAESTHTHTHIYIYIYKYIYKINLNRESKSSTKVSPYRIIRKPNSTSIAGFAKVFSFLLTNWLCIPWFFSRGRTRLAFSFFLSYDIFSFFPRAVIRDTFISCSWRGFFRFFFLVTWMLVDIRLVNIYIEREREKEREREIERWLLKSN